MSSEATTAHEPMTTDEVAAYAEWKQAAMAAAQAQLDREEAQKRYVLALNKLTDIVLAAKKPPAP